MIFNIGTNEPTFDFSVTGFSGAKVTIANEKGSITKTTGSDGSAVFEKLKKGTWQVTATDGKESAAYEVQIGRGFSNTLNINSIPTFLYNGSYKIVDDNDNVITQSLKNWKIRFLSTGTLNFRELKGAAGGIDVFCVGGGGNGGNYNEGLATAAGGGGGGYTTTKRGVDIQIGTYDIAVGGSGETTYAFKGTPIEVTAKNGKNGTIYDGTSAGASGGDGGSGGGGIGCVGGSDGGDGGTVTTSVWGNGGKGQGNPPGTREFHEPTGKLYAGGGGGGAYQKIGASGGSGGGGQGGGGQNVGKNGTANTGGGGGGGGWAWGAGDAPGKGGSGIVIIRNKR